jgi:crotonobetainyl-CoA:carnitine CoA-transferase CaiB-like acyl-CoA transferase
MLETAEHQVAGLVPHIGVVPKLSETPGRVGGAAPLLGQHSREVFLRAGLASEEIEDLERAGVILAVE